MRLHRHIEQTKERTIPTRLARQDEIVERMARAFCIARGRDPDTLHQLYNNEYPVDATDEKGRKYYKAWRLSAKPSTAALSAMLDAVVELGVGVPAISTRHKLKVKAPDETEYTDVEYMTASSEDLEAVGDDALILRVETSDDK